MKASQHAWYRAYYFDDDGGVVIGTILQTRKVYERTTVDYASLRWLLITED